MRDDERYPTPVYPPDYHDAPEVSPQQQPVDLSGRDKVVSDRSVPDEYKEEDSESPAIPGAIGSGASSRKYCGLRRRTLLVVVAVVAVIVIAAVVGGVVGGIKAHNSNAAGKDSSSDTGSPTSTSSSTPTSSASAPGGTGPIQASQRGVAASLSADAKSQDVQVFYQDLNTTDIFYQRVKNDRGGQQHTLNLSITPDWGTPLAAAAVNGSDPISVQLFYVVTPPNANTSSIAEAILSCDPNSDNCATQSNSIISNTTSFSILPQTKLAAVRFDQSTIRVYCQATKYHIWALIGDKATPDGGGWTAAHIDGGGFPGTSLMAFGPNKTNINVLFVSNVTDRLRIVRYNDLIGPGKDASVDDSPGSEWSTSVSLAGLYAPQGNPYRFFYAQPSQGTIISYFQTPTNTNFQPYNDKAWGKVDGGLAAVTWANQVRLFYFNGDELVMSSQNGGVWAQPKSISGS